MIDFLQARPDGVMLAMDQMSLFFQATLTRVWSRQGHIPPIHISAKHDYVYSYDLFYVSNGPQNTLPLSGQTSGLNCHFLDYLQACYPGRALLILWDRAKWHKGKVFQTYLQQHSHLQILHFPPGSPPSRTCFGAYPRCREPQLYSQRLFGLG